MFGPARFIMHRSSQSSRVGRKYGYPVNRNSVDVFIPLVLFQDVWFFILEGLFGYPCAG
jgi:hypothetical protein